MTGFSRTFKIILIGQFVSIAGSTLTAAGMGFWVYEQTGTVTGFALNMLMFYLPGILLSPVAGILADRLNRRWAMIISDTGSAGTTLIILVLLLAGQLEVWHVYALVFVSQVFGTLQWPAYSAAIAQMVPTDKLGQASGMVEMARALPQLFAPAAAGVLYMAGGLRTIILIDAVTFVAAVGTLLVVQLPPPRESSIGAEAAQETFWQQMTFGLRYIAARGSLIGLMAYYALFNFLFAMFETLIMPLMLNYYTEGMVGLGASIAALGTLAGSVVMSMWGGPKRRAFGVLGCGLVAFAMMTLLGTTVRFWWVIGYAFVMLAMLPIVVGSSQALWQAKVEHDIQGRVFAVRQVAAQAMMPLALIMVGPLADGPLQTLVDSGGLPIADGASLAFILFGTIGMVGTLLAFAVPAIRRADLLLPDQTHDEHTAPGDPVPVPSR